MKRKAKNPIPPTVLPPQGPSLPRVARPKSEERERREKAAAAVLEQLTGEFCSLDVLAQRTGGLPERLVADILAEHVRAGRARAELRDGVMRYRDVGAGKSKRVHLERLDEGERNLFTGAPVETTFCGEKVETTKGEGAEKRTERLPLTRSIVNATCSKCLKRLAKYPQARRLYEEASRAA